jgi:hypothetical protein
MKAAFSLVITLAGTLGAEEQVTSIRGNGYVEEAWIVPPEAFTIEGLRKRARSFIQRHAASAFVQLEVSVGPGVRFYGGKGTNHVPIENYFYRLHHIYPDGVEAYGDIASLIKIGRAAVLRIRKGGRVYSIDVGGDGFPMPGSAAGFQILHIGPQFNRGTVDGVEVFVRCHKRMTQGAVTKLARELRVLNPLLRVWVIARTDAWFVTEPRFPFLYAFDDPVMVPTLEEYRRRAPGMVAVDPQD